MFEVIFLAPATTWEQFAKKPKSDLRITRINPEIAGWKSGVRVGFVYHQWGTLFAQIGSIFALSPT